MNSTGRSLAMDACGWPIVPPSSSIAAIRYLDLITYPFFLLLATVGNFFNLAVLCKRDKGRSRSKSTYIIAIAIADLTFMWISIFTYIHNYNGDLNDGVPDPWLTDFYNQIAGAAMFIQEVVAFASAWMIIAFTAERFLAIRWPMIYHRTSHGKRSIHVVLIIFLLACVIAAVRLVDYYRYYALFLAPSPRPPRPPPRPTWLLQWYTAYLWIQASVQIGTFLIILILNLWLLRTILEQRRFRKETLQPSLSAEEQAKRTGRSDWSTLPMLGVCVLLYLITQIPELIDNAVFLLEKGCVYQSSSELKAVVKPLTNVLANINFSLNFLLYCGVDGQFRQKLGGLFRSWKSTSELRTGTSRVGKLLAVIPSHGTKSTSSGGSSSSKECTVNKKL
ncbi:hypothetical protein BV898_09333 [Hypsibius exemplaris]|uniref:G-protein coupled receptors family 1 profile domain-containing protein n=1 Tax=Hypsibius exemplaris TaxID=2072580 RepID=A0A1W0WMQ1_HYPEX|nr:hypothetical protein BV898_09333 [Hypsibius exemplaris]